MTKTITIGRRPVNLRASARTVWEYREIFGGDLVREMNHVTADEFGFTGESYQTFERLAWLMARDGGEEMDTSLPEREQLPAWLETFDNILAIHEASLEISKFWRESATGTSVPKKNSARQ